MTMDRILRDSITIHTLMLKTFSHHFSLVELVHRSAVIQAPASSMLDHHPVSVTQVAVQIVNSTVTPATTTPFSSETTQHVYEDKQKINYNSFILAMRKSMSSFVFSSTSG